MELSCLLSSFETKCRHERLIPLDTSIYSYLSNIQTKQNGPHEQQRTFLQDHLAHATCPGTPLLMLQTHDCNSASSLNLPAGNLCANVLKLEKWL